MNWVLTVNIVTLIAILGFGYRIISFINLLEYKVGTLWSDYEYRMNLMRNRQDSTTSITLERHKETA